MKLDIQKLIIDESDKTKLLLISIFLYKKMVFKNPFSSLSYIYSLEQPFNILDIMNLDKYKNELLKKIREFIEANNLEEDDFLNDISSYIKFKVEEYHYLTNCDNCFLYWIHIFDAINNNNISHNTIPHSNRYDLLVKTAEKLFETCNGDFALVRKNMVIFMYEDNYPAFLNLFDYINDGNVAQYYVTARLNLIVNSSSIKIENYLTIVDANWIISFISNYLNKNNIMINSIFNKQIYTENGKIECIKVILNYYIYQNKERIKLFNESFKRAIAQKKYRGNEKKKTLNIQISKEAKSKLDDLLYYHSVNQPRYIEILINEAYEKINISK